MKGGRWRVPGGGIALLLLVSGAGLTAWGACESCGDFGSPVSWGQVAVDALTEASGLAVSARNPGVVWAHNDGSRSRVLALGTNGVLLASFNLRHDVEDLEDLAVGPGPVAGTRYLLEPLSVDQAGTYTVVATNALGSATNQMTLTVRPKPDLRITEVQSSTAPSTSTAGADWWELTSFEPQTVDLSGWRFNDQTGAALDAFVIPAGWSIGPGESLVLVEALTPAQFRAWWGESNVPAEVRIVSYQGSGLSFAASGDGVRLWSSTVGTSGELVASVDFGVATHGVTFNYDPGERAIRGRQPIGGARRLSGGVGRGPRLAGTNPGAGGGSPTAGGRWRRRLSAGVRGGGGPDVPRGDTPGVVGCHLAADGRTQPGGEQQSGGPGTADRARRGVLSAPGRVTVRGVSQAY